jgi:hypothetical protein
VLAQRMDGFTGGQLGVELYGDEASPVTLRAEMVRLRRRLGAELLGSRPYRLRAPVVTDAAQVMRLVEKGSMTEALRRYRGPVLPPSEAPGVERIRRGVEQQIRAGLVGAADPALLLRWSRTPWGRDDLEMWELLARRAPAGAVRSLAVREAGRLAARTANAPRPDSARGAEHAPGTRRCSGPRTPPLRSGRRFAKRCAYGSLAALAHRADRVLPGLRQAPA